MPDTKVFIGHPSFTAMDEFIHGGRRLTFHPITADNWTHARHSDSWVFLDIFMAGVSGLEICRRLRSDDANQPARIVIILEEDDLDLRRRALVAGADDYLIAPIDRMRILDRILSSEGNVDVLRAARVVNVGRMSVNAEAMRVDWEGKPITLPLKEFKLLLLLAENPNRVLTRQEICAGLGHSPDAVDLRTVDVWIGRLRAGLREAGAGDVLRTVRQIGYALDII